MAIDQSPAAPSGPRRRPATGGYARGDAKRTRIIEAAVRRFGEDGYAATSTRQIAQDAGVNPPALQYYFNSKEGLYDACHAHIVQAFAAAMRDAYARSAAIGPAERDAAIDTFCDLMDTLADFVFETAEARGWGRLFARVRARDDLGPLDEARKNQVGDEYYRHCFRLAALATGGTAESLETRLRALAATGMLTAFHLERDEMLRRLGWPDLRGERLATFKAMLRRQARAALAPQGLGVAG